MITRDVGGLYVVPAFQHNAKFIACGQTNLGTCTCAGGVASAVGASSTGAFPGFIIDRLGLGREFNSLILAPSVFAEINSSDNVSAFQHYAISLGLQHACTTGGTFLDYSTQRFVMNQGLWRQTTATATACAMYTAIQRDVADVLGGVLTTTTSTAGGVTVVAGSTSTGYAYYAGPAAYFDLSGAKRFVRAVVAPVINSTACGSGGMSVAVTAVFGEPAYLDHTAAAITGTGGANYGLPLPVKRILVTTGCAT